MSEDEVARKLMEIQNKIDDINMEALKEEFLVRQQSFLKMKEMLEERNKIISGIEGFWENVILGSEFVDILFTTDPEKEDSESLEAGWISSLSVEYRPNFKHYVSIRTKDNEYFENEILEKEFSLFETNECNYTTINWKGKKTLDNSLIRFFSSEDSAEGDDNLSMFQILFDLYINSVYYYTREDMPGLADRQ